MYYDLAYKPQPFPFRTGANDGFHEGIGDTLALSCNTAYLRQAARASLHAMPCRKHHAAMQLSNTLQANRHSAACARARPHG